MQATSLTPAIENSPNRLDFNLQNPLGILAKNIAQKLPSISNILKHYNQLSPANSAQDFAQNALDALQITLNYNHNELNNIPKSGATLLVANHPYGGIEGLATATLFGKIRPDLKILANNVLCAVSELKPMLIPVNVFGKNKSNNIHGVRAALKHLEAGGALAVFPSGAVSHLHLSMSCITDPSWNQFVGKLAKQKDVNTIPIHFSGNNSTLFQLIGYIHPLLRTALLPRELWRQRGNNLIIKVGKCVDKKVITGLADNKAITAHLRTKCYNLVKKEVKPASYNKEIVKQLPEHTICLEIEQLKSNNLIADEGDYQVFHTNYKNSSAIIHEIGRLREETFREINEGSGNALDLDKYDQDYMHLVLWHKADKKIAGSYRLRYFTANENFNEKLYTSTLFKFKQAFFIDCKNAMELGRAFIANKYQRDYLPLSMLWKGIAHLAAKANIRTLFGPASIGLAYQKESIEIIRKYLTENYFDKSLAKNVKGRCIPNKLKTLNTLETSGLDYNIANRIVKDIEEDKAIPILFKHYLQLGGKIVAFHEDKNFNTLDSLLVVDLAKTPEKALLKYMTHEKLQTLKESYN